MYCARLTAWGMCTVCVHVENQFLFLLMGKRCWNLAETIRRKMNHIKWFSRSLLLVGGVSFSGAFFSLDFRYVWKRTMKHMLLHEQSTFLQTPVIKQIRHNRERASGSTYTLARNETKRIEIRTKKQTFLFLSIELCDAFGHARASHNGR